MSWFGVETTARPEESLTSQAQPEPKRAIAGVFELVLEGVERAEGRGDRATDVTGRLAAAVGAHHLPEERVVVMATGVVADRALLVAGQARQVGEDVLDRAIGPVGALERRIRFVDVGLVVFVVVDTHRRLVDVGLERVVRVWQSRYLESHLGLLLSVYLESLRAYPAGALAKLPAYSGSTADGTASGLPPVHSTKRYQEGFAS